MDLAKLKTDVAAHLGIAATHFGQRVDRMVGNLAARLESDLKYSTQQAYEAAVDQLGALSLREVCLLLAEGPTEQTRALMAPQAVAAESGIASPHPDPLPAGEGGAS